MNNHKEMREGIKELENLISELPTSGKLTVNAEQFRVLLIKFLKLAKKHLLLLESKL